MTYNAAGLRAGYTVTPYGAGQPSLSEQFTYRGGQLAQTVTITGTTTYTDTYVYSQHGMPLELLRTTNGVLNRYWYERDGLGNVVALTDVNGTVVDQYAYDLWGKPTIVYESVPQQLRYQGYWYDNELGWYWLTSRAYDPGIKRFLQPDASELDGLFSYVYVGDDPVDMHDPSGFAAAPMYCDSYCQTLIVLDNVWPTGMSVDQFKANGGNPDGPGYVGVNSGPHQWNEYTPEEIKRSGGLLLTVDHEQTVDTTSITFYGHIDNFTGENIVVSGGEERLTETCAGFPPQSRVVPFGPKSLHLTHGGAISSLGSGIGFSMTLIFVCNQIYTAGGVTWTEPEPPVSVFGQVEVWGHRNFITSGGVQDFLLDSLSNLAGLPAGRYATWSNPITFTLGSP